MVRSRHFLFQEPKFNPSLGDWDPASQAANKNKIKLVTYPSLPNKPKLASEEVDPHHMSILRVPPSCFVVVVVQSISCVRLFATPWTLSHQAPLSITASRSLPKFMSIESMTPSNRLILCCPLFLLPSIFPSIRVFSSDSALHFSWPKY